MLKKLLEDEPREYKQEVNPTYTQPAYKSVQKYMQEAQPRNKYINETK